MAQDSHPTQSTDELIAAISRNREVLAVHRAALHRTSHVKSRLQHSYQEHTGLFLGSAAVFGLLLSFIPSSRRSRREMLASLRAEATSEPVKRKASRSMGAVILGLAGKIALDLGKPIVLKMVRDHYSAALHPHPASQPSEGSFPAA